MNKGRMNAHKHLLVQIREALKDEVQRQALKKATRRFLEDRKAALSQVEDVEKLKEHLKKVRLSTITHLDLHLERLTRHVESRGGKVVRARSGEEAVQYVLSLARKNNVRLVVKSKSMTAEEIHLNSGLESAGICVVETDLGERIVQLAGEKPSHLIAPAVHKTAQQVADLFSEDTGKKVPCEIGSITMEARNSLRRAFLSADMGITGVNFAVAETGTLIIVTNEGNARLATGLPKIHVAIMGEEKVVPKMEDALLALRLLTRSATGQKLTSYVTFLTGQLPYSQTSTAQREFHLIILDNGRRRMRASTRFVEAQACIRCGACLNVCPTYQVVGGHVFGDVYTGAIGIPWTAFTGSELAAFRMASLCISCGLCEDACPVKIKIPELIMRVKEADVERYGSLKPHQFISRIDTLSRLASLAAPVSNYFLRNSSFRYLLEKASGLDRRRPFPPYTRKPFLKQFKGYKSKGPRKAAYFVDLYANYNDPELAKAVVRILEKNGVGVTVPEQLQAGMPLLMYGNVKAAEKLMRFNVEKLMGAVREGCDIVASEPTAAYCLRRIYPDFLATEEAEAVASHTYDLFEYLWKLYGEGRLTAPFEKLPKQKVGYHIPCHGRSTPDDNPTKKVLELIGLEVKVLEFGCCGMGGTYGYKKGEDGFDMSMEIGKGLFELVMDPTLDLIVTESSVCKLQIETGTKRVAVHPAMLLNRAYVA